MGAMKLCVYRLKIHKLETKSFVVPNAAVITIIAESNGKRLESSSCHTLFEANRKLVARCTVNNVQPRSVIVGVHACVLQHWKERVGCDDACHPS